MSGTDNQCIFLFISVRNQLKKIIVHLKLNFYQTDSVLKTRGKLLAHEKRKL